MITVRQIERLWLANSSKKLYRELVGARPEALFRLDAELCRPAAVSALAMVRLEELSQSYVPFYGRLLRAVLAAQEADGGWGDPAATALCVRALLCGKGDGVAIERGLAYLANLQKPEGIWPAGPLRRMPEDPAVSLFILGQLGSQASFREAVRFGDALAWFKSHAGQLEEAWQGVWQRTSLRCAPRANAAPGLFAA